MVGDSLRALWDEPRSPHPPIRVWRDWALFAVVVTSSVVEVAVREDRAWLPVAAAVSAVIALSLLWRRTHPLAAVTGAFGTLIVFDLARIVAGDATGLLSIAAALVLPYALARWGAGREVTSGLGLVLVWLAITHVADPTGPAELVAGYGFFLFSAALGAAIRFHATTRIRDIEQAGLRQRNELARELHDTLGHHVSAIAIQAQAGRALAASDPARALTVLGTIEDAASRALEEMRAMVGILRDTSAPDLAPQPTLTDLERLASDVDDSPRVGVHLSGDLDGLAAPIATALHRIAQEAITNARRHARSATRVAVEVIGDAGEVRLTIRDDGAALTAVGPTSGYGLVGMAERASLFGGTFRAGPAPEGGWTVEVTLPRDGPNATRTPAAVVAASEGRRGSPASRSP